MTANIEERKIGYWERARLALATLDAKNQAGELPSPCRHGFLEGYPTGAPGIVLIADHPDALQDVAEAICQNQFGVDCSVVQAALDLSNPTPPGTKLALSDTVIDRLIKLIQRVNDSNKELGLVSEGFFAEALPDEGHCCLHIGLIVPATIEEQAAIGVSLAQRLRRSLTFSVEGQNINIDPGDTEVEVRERWLPPSVFPPKSVLPDVLKDMVIELGALLASLQLWTPGQAFPDGVIIVDDNNCFHTGADGQIRVKSRTLKLSFSYRPDPVNTDEESDDD